MKLAFDLWSAMGQIASRIRHPATKDGYGTGGSESHMMQGAVDLLCLPVTGTISLVPEALRLVLFRPFFHREARGLILTPDRKHILFVKDVNGDPILPLLKRVDSFAYTLPGYENEVGRFFALKEMWDGYSYVYYGLFRCGVFPQIPNSTLLNLREALNYVPRNVLWQIADDDFQSVGETLRCHYLRTFQVAPSGWKVTRVTRERPYNSYTREKDGARAEIRVTIHDRITWEVTTDQGTWKSEDDEERSFVRALKSVIAHAPQLE